MTMQAMKKVTESRPSFLLPKKTTYSATIDWREQEHVITDSMIRRACEDMDAAQQYPFGGDAPKRNLVAKPAPPRRLHS
ncbi:MAG: hypothetical protein ACR2PS_07090 [Pseudomonadales bacterium]